MKPRYRIFHSTSGLVHGSLLTLCTASCPAENPSSCGYIGWGGSATESATESTTSVSATTSASLPTSPTGMDEGDLTTDDATSTTVATSVSDATTIEPTTDAETSQTGEVTATSTGEPTDPVGCETDTKNLSELLGIAEPIAAGQGIFVHPTKGDDTSDGGPATPKATLQGALAVVTPEHPFIFLCTINEDSPTESIPAADKPGLLDVTGSISIIGGMFCQNSEWKFPPDSGRRTRISGSVGVGLRVEPGITPARLAHLELNVSPSASLGEAQYGDTDQARLGGSAIGLIVKGGALDLLEVTVKTLDAGPGKDGNSLEGVGANVGTSLPAVQYKCCPKIGACALSPPDSPLCHTGQSPSRGGIGGMGGAVDVVGDAGFPGELVKDAGEGGMGGVQPGTCELNGIGAGENGSKGPALEVDGIWENVSSPFGALSIDGYTAQAGRDGFHGANGGGGGGGRGAKGPMNAPIICNGGFLYHTAFGGGGGGGGCGGRGGVGGGSGGSSIAIVSLGASVRILDSQLTAGNGGRGGNAGGRQLGAAGSPGHLGIKLGMEDAFNSCPGGKGGDGRDGRFAGAGMGGHSVAVAYLGAKPLLCGSSMNAITIGQAGEGGKAEAAAPAEVQELLAGHAGEQASILKFCPPAPEPCN